MEYKNVYFAIIGVIGTLFWLLDFFKVFQKTKLYAPQNHGRPSTFRRVLRIFTLLIGLAGWAFLSYSLMQPRKPETFSSAKIKVNDIVLCLDVSRSMLADDILPNRLEAMKEKVREFARLRPTDRISVVLFSEKVITLLPLTTDPALLDQVLAEISIGYLGSGTNIGDGLALSVARLLESPTKNRIVILLTDGVANVGTLTPIQAAEEAKKYGMKVHTIGFGTDNDARIPVGNGLFGTQYQRIPGGSIDFDTLKEIAKMTDGNFYPAKSKEALKDILDDLNRLEKTEIEKNEQVVYEELFFQYMLYGILLLVASELLRKLALRDVV
jgi:Ca-activated chloride channel family protein